MWKIIIITESLAFNNQLHWNLCPSWTKVILDGLFVLVAATYFLLKIVFINSSSAWGQSWAVQWISFRSQMFCLPLLWAHVYSCRLCSRKSTQLYFHNVHNVMFEWLVTTNAHRLSYRNQHNKWLIFLLFIMIIRSRCLFVLSAQPCSCKIQGWLRWSAKVEVEEKHDQEIINWSFLITKPTSVRRPLKLMFAV